MSDQQPPGKLFNLAAAEIFKSLRLELIPRHRRNIPPVLFMHRRDPASGELNVTSFQLANQPRDAWPRTIALLVSQSEAEWWAVSVELRLKVRDEDLGGDEDDIPNESSWLVVVVCSTFDQQVWWSQLQRDETGRLAGIDPERRMPRGPVREEVLQMLGNRFYPLDA